MKIVVYCIIEINEVTMNHQDELYETVTKERFTDARGGHLLKKNGTYTVHKLKDSVLKKLQERYKQLKTK